MNLRKGAGSTSAGFATFSFVAALESGRTSWTAILDVLRVRPTDDHTDLAATQLRTIVDTLLTAGLQLVPSLTS
jgi:hypothetical protein